MTDVAYVVTESDDSDVYFAANEDEAASYWAMDHCGCCGEDECDCQDRIEIEREPRFDRYLDHGIPLEAFRDAGWKRPCYDCMAIDGLSAEFAICGTGDWDVRDGRSICHSCLGRRGEVA